MAYRELKFGDLVRIVNPSSPLHGRNGAVIGYDEMIDVYRVQVRSGRGDFGTTTTAWMKSGNLLVRNDSYDFVVDGRVDHEAKAKYDADLQRRIVNFEDRFDEFEPCGNCPCCEAHNRI